MKKKVEKPISDYFRKLAKKSWKIRKEKLLKAENLKVAIKTETEK